MMRRMHAEDPRSPFASRHPLLLVEEQDEERFLRLLRGAAGELGLPVWIWYSTKGLARDGFDPQYGTRDAALALSFVADVADAAVFAFVDVHPAIADPTLVRRVKDVVQGTRRGRPWSWPRPAGPSRRSSPASRSPGSSPRRRSRSWKAW